MPEPVATAPGQLRSLGILGGTFNPPHLGHLAIARHAQRELGLVRVVLIPAGAPPHKPIAQDPGAQRRLEMCRLLLDGIAEACVSALELERDGPSYTVDTLRAVHESNPQAALTFIVGADVASTLPAWHEANELLELAELAVAARPGSDRDGVLDALAPLGDPARVRFLDAPLLDVSSSSVRERAAKGSPLQPLVGPGVAGYIVEHGLYGARERVASR